MPVYLKRDNSTQRHVWNLAQAPRDWALDIDDKTTPRLILGKGHGFVKHHVLLNLSSVRRYFCVVVIKRMHARA